MRENLILMNLYFSEYTKLILRKAKNLDEDEQDDEQGADANLGKDPFQHFIQYQNLFFYYIII